MKQSAWAHRVLLIVYIGACLALFPAFIHFYNLTEADVFRAAHVENHVLGDHLVNLEKRWVGFGVTVHSQIFSENSHFNLYPVFSRALSSSEGYSPLRC